jgi:NADP-dependent 3-hydroxy acid dehydrogenase YdfG
MARSNQAAYLPESVEGKNVLITGGTTGIGLATALLLASQGANVLIFGRHQQELDDARQHFKEQGLEKKVTGLVADVAKPADIARIFKETDERFDALDILVNNAGLAFDGIQKGKYKDWQYIVQTNLLGYIACAHEAIDRMRKKVSGHIVNIGSMSADVREKGSSLYVATKAGVQGFSEALRKEVNPLGVKVSLIEPGSVGTDMQPAEGQALKEENLKMLKAEDIAACVLYVLSQPRRCDVVSVQIRPHLQAI